MKYVIFIVSVIVVNFCSAHNNDFSQKTKEKMSSESFTEYNDIERVEPSNWWVGFENQRLQLLVKDENVCLHCGLCAERCPTSAWDIQKFFYNVTKAGKGCH